MCFRQLTPLGSYKQVAREKISLTYSIKPTTMTLDTVEPRRHLLRQAQFTVTLKVKCNADCTLYRFRLCTLACRGCSGQVCQSLLCLPKDGATEP